MTNANAPAIVAPREEEEEEEHGEGRFLPAAKPTGHRTVRVVVVVVVGGLL